MISPSASSSSSLFLFTRTITSCFFALAAFSHVVMVAVAVLHQMPRKTLQPSHNVAIFRHFSVRLLLMRLHAANDCSMHGVHELLAVFDTPPYVSPANDSDLFRFSEYVADRQHSHTFTTNTSHTHTHERTHTHTSHPDHHFAKKIQQPCILRIASLSPPRSAPIPLSSSPPLPIQLHHRGNIPTPTAHPRCPQTSSSSLAHL